MKFGAYSYIPMSKIATYSGGSSLLLGIHDVMPLLRICYNAAREDKHKTYQNATNDVVKGMTWCFREKVTTRTSNPIKISLRVFTHTPTAFPVVSLLIMYVF